ncbi:MAG: GIY-YIG nuclease family protein [Planctomycetaceae bacterium]|nr:GIY-YIG nuclease family protein [Planctomycetaceae bacterium]
MLTFNALLAAVNIEPEVVRLVRHRDPKYNRAIYDDAVRRHARFEQYQSVQGSPRVISMLRTAQVLVAFVVDPRGETVFVGLWRVRGVKSGYVSDPYRGPVPVPSKSSASFDLQRMPELDEYAGRVIVDWGGGGRAWVQYAHRRDKPILELRRKAVEESFPGFARFTCRLDEVDGLPMTWQEPLRGTRGIYLLVERATGAQYVGSATGSGGFLGRWKQYANGHGGNAGLRELMLDAHEYDVCILETAGSGAELEDVYAIETLWKQKLGSRARGLNRN